MTRPSFPFIVVAGAVAAAVLSPMSAAAEGQSTVIHGVQWALATNGRDVPWPAAERYCADLDLDGRDDWRLPTLAELEAMHDPQRAGGIRAPIDIDTCCLWSSTSLVERDSPDSGEIGGSPEMYRWGFMFDAGVAYYAVNRFDDGQALCVRDVGNRPAEAHQ